MKWPREWAIYKIQVWCPTSKVCRAYWEPHTPVQYTRKTFMIHQTFVQWALCILFKFTKSLMGHLGLAIGNVRHVQWFSWTLLYVVDWVRERKLSCECHRWWQNISTDNKSTFIGVGNGLLTSGKKPLPAGWAIADPDLCGHMVPLLIGHNELTDWQPRLTASKLDPHMTACTSCENRLR